MVNYPKNRRAMIYLISLAFSKCPFNSTWNLHVKVDDFTFFKHWTLLLSHVSMTGFTQEKIQRKNHFLAQTIDFDETYTYIVKCYRF